MSRAVLGGALAAAVGVAAQTGPAAAGARANPAGIVINEFVAENDAGLRDGDGDFSDWIELHNSGGARAGLAGCYLTDDARELAKWRLPEVVLEAGAFLVVFASGKDRARAGAELHTNFKLQAGGEYLALVAPDGRNVLHEFAPAYPKQRAGISYGLPPEGAARAGVRLAQGFLVEPTPGRANAPVSAGEVAPVVLSATRGFHEAPIFLTLSTETDGAEIRYTTDGTRPAEGTGRLYQAPLRIDRTSVLRVAAFKPQHRPSRVKTHTFLFAADIIRQSPDGLPAEGFPYAWGANQVDYGMDPRVVDDPRYRDEIVAGLKSLPSFSVVMDLDDLFDARKGIYANAYRDGRDWERPCSLELIHADGSKGFQIDCGIRIRGGFSRTPENPKHAFRLFFRDQYGPGRLQYPLFGDRGAKEFENLDLRTSQNYSWSMSGDPSALFVNDQFCRDLQAAAGHPSARGDFCHLYINGQYWGLFNTCERPEASYGATYFGGEKAEYDVIKKGGEVTDGNREAWERLYRMSEQDLTNNAAYFALLGRNPDGSVKPSAEVLLDVDNLIDHMLITFYTGNLDGSPSWFGHNRGANNWFAIRNRNGREGFRFFVWDAEHTMLLGGPNDGLYENRTGPFRTGESFGSSNAHGYWQRCLANSEFRLRVADRVYRHFYNGGLFTPDSIRARFLARAKEIESAVVCESARWGDSYERGGRGRQGPRNRDDHWRKELDRVVREYIPRRSDIVLAQIFEHGVLPDFDPPVFTQFGGAVPAGYRLELESPMGTIYYTTDGTDPRRVGGAIAAPARRYETPVLIERPTTVKARVLRGSEWSALAEARFRVE